MKSQELHTTPQGAPAPLDIIPPMLNPKKSRRKLLIIAAILLLVLAGASYYFIASNQTDAPVETVIVTDEPTNPTIEAITKSLTDSFNEESALTNADDTADVTNASNDAAPIEESVDENDL